MLYLLAFIASISVVGIITPVMRKMAMRLKIVDVPDESRKIHARPTPLLGGLAVFIGLMAVLWYVALATPYVFSGAIQFKHLVGFSVGGFILIVGGYLDERHNLSPARQIIFPILAALIVIGSGIGIRFITNPGGGTFSLAQWERVLFWWQGVGYRLTLPADFLTLAWLMVVMYTTKLLDGLDGLVSGMTAIGAFMIFLLATATAFFQPEVGMFAIIAAGAFVGFLFWNWHPAKMFLGTSGSTLAGFILGVLAIISGGKIATALLVLGIPILDVVWVVARRIMERKNPLRADQGHLHFRLLNAGWSQRSVVIFYWVIAALFGMTTLFLQSSEKLVALGLLAAMMVTLAFWVVRKRAEKAQ